MKIVHCFFTMRTGGAQLLAIDMLNSLSLSHDTTLIVINDQWDSALLQTLNRKVAVYCLNRRENGRNPWPLIRLNALLHQLKPDVIHCHERRMSQLIFYRGAKTVYTIHDVDVPTQTFNQYDALVAISQSVAADVYKRAGLPINIINNGIAIDQFKKRTSYVLRSDEPIRLIQVSRLVHEKKGQDILLKAVAKLTRERPEFSVTLDLVGDGPSIRYLTQLTETLQISQLVNFSGERSRGWISDHLADYHMLVQPSRYEGFGLTVLEGLAAGLPVVASAIDGPAEIMEGLAAGALFASEDVDACMDALVNVITLYRNSRIQAAMTETQAAIRLKFSIEATVDGYSNLYKHLCTQPGPVSTGQRTVEQFWRSLLPQ